MWKRNRQDRVTTILPRQGHYAQGFTPGAEVSPDIIIDHIAGLADDPRLRDLISRHLHQRKAP